MTDRELIEWTAHARVGDVLPAEYMTAGGTSRLLERLADLGAIAPPPVGTVINAMCLRAREDCRAWLREHSESR